MGLSRDQGGIEGLPLQLLIVAIVAGITAPLVYAGLDAYDRGEVARRVEGEVLRPTRAAQQYAVAGGGGEASVLEYHIGLSLSAPYRWRGGGAGAPCASLV